MRKSITLIKATLEYYKKFIFVALILYCLSIIVGIICFSKDKIPVIPKSFSFLELLQHNGLTMLLIIVLGIVSFGVIGNFILIANGIVLGRILIGVYNLYGMDPILHHIAPHFFIETLALILCTAVSYETYKFFYNIRHINRQVIKLRYVTINITISIIALMIAALIESQL